MLTCQKALCPSPLFKQSEENQPKNKTKKEAVGWGRKGRGYKSESSERTKVSRRRSYERPPRRGNGEVGDVVWVPISVGGREEPDRWFHRWLYREGERRGAGQLLWDLLALLWLKRCWLVLGLGFSILSTSVTTELNLMHFPELPPHHSSPPLP